MRRTDKSTRGGKSEQEGAESAEMFSSASFATSCKKMPRLITLKCRQPSKEFNPLVNT